MQVVADEKGDVREVFTYFTENKSVCKETLTHANEHKKYSSLHHVVSRMATSMQYLYRASPHSRISTPRSFRDAFSLHGLLTRVKHVSALPLFRNSTI
jgi:hypothetical protein